jgi:hypothetical protein
MRKILQLVLIMMVSAGCNLSTSLPTDTPRPTFAATLTPMPTTAAASAPTILPLVGFGETRVAPPTARPTTIPVTSVPVMGVQCQVYTTYSGTDPNNKLSLRVSPSATAAQVFRVPNNAQVLLVPNTQEVAADEYHWLNMIYVDSTGMRYQGWMARDSYTRGGVRDTSIVTLVPTGTQVSC